MKTKWIKIGDERIKVSSIVRYIPYEYNYTGNKYRYEIFIYFSDKKKEEYHDFKSKEERDERLKQLDDIFLK